jgi:hypothetical protein
MQFLFITLIQLVALKHDKQVELCSNDRTLYINIAPTPNRFVEP